MTTIPNHSNYELYMDGGVPVLFSKLTRRYINGRVFDNGYRVYLLLTDDGSPPVNYYAHVLVARLHIHNPNPKVLYWVDHINGDKLDNRVENLRWVTPTTNGLNRTSTKGYSFNKTTGKYVARIRYDGKTHYIGSYKTPEEAHGAYLIKHNSVMNELLARNVDESVIDES